MLESKYIEIRGARQHNLKNVDINIPKNSLTVITGLSGSGKSSLAFDTIYAEGQRRYVESLSSYARQFLDLQNKPDVDSIEGLSPAISIEQKPHRTIRVPQLARLQKFMTICVCCGQEPELLILRQPDCRLRRSLFLRWLIKFWLCRKEQNLYFWRRLPAVKRGV